MVACDERVVIESGRLDPKSVFDGLVRIGWNLEGARMHDVSAGQSEALLGTLQRDAEAENIEPKNHGVYCA